MVDTPHPIQGAVKPRTVTRSGAGARVAPCSQENNKDNNSPETYKESNTQKRTQPRILTLPSVSLVFEHGEMVAALH